MFQEAAVIPGYPCESVSKKSHEVGTIWNLLDASAAKANSYQYDAFGVSRSVSKTVSNKRRFGTKRLDIDADPGVWRIVGHVLLLCALGFVVGMGACARAVAGREIHKAVKRGDLDSVRALLAEHPELVHLRDDEGGTPLHVACAAVNLEMARTLLDHGADVNADVAGATALLAAAYSRPPPETEDPVRAIIELVSVLLDSGAKVETWDVHGSTPLHGAATLGLEEVAKMLLAEGARVNAANDRRSTPLHQAVWSNLPGMVRILLDHGAYAVAKNKWGCTPFEDAVASDCGANTMRGGQESLVEVFLRAGVKDKIHLAAGRGDAKVVSAFLNSHEAFVRRPDGLGWRPLHWATWYGQQDVVQLLLDAGVDVNQRDLSGLGPLDLAAGRGFAEIARLLLRKGAAVEARGGSELTPLHWAAASGRAGVAQLLLEAGALADAADRVGETPLLYCARRNCPDVAVVLLEGGANPNPRGDDGGTPLHEAVLQDAAQVAEVLLAHGADVKARDDWLWTPLHVAGASGHKAIVEELLANGAIINARDAKGKTPLGVALERGHQEAVQVLRQHGGVE